MNSMITYTLFRMNIFSVLVHTLFGKKMKQNSNYHPHLQKYTCECLQAQLPLRECFSISGHVFNSKRRRMGLTIFAMLVFLKLNENLLVLN
jgi:hypothetical protein